MRRRHPKLCAAAAMAVALVASSCQTGGSIDHVGAVSATTEAPSGNAAAAAAAPAAAALEPQGLQATVEALTAAASSTTVPAKSPPTTTTTTTTTSTTTTLPPTTTATRLPITFTVFETERVESAFVPEPWQRVQIQWFMPEGFSGRVLISENGPGTVDDEWTHLADLTEPVGEFERVHTAYGRYHYRLVPVDPDGEDVLTVWERETIRFWVAPPSTDIERAWHQIAKRFPEFGEWPDIRLLPDIAMEFRSNRCGYNTEACVDRDELAAGHYTIRFAKSFTPRAYYHEVGHVLHYLAWPEESRTGATPTGISSWHTICEDSSHQWEYYCDSWEEWVAVAFEDSIMGGRVKRTRCATVMVRCAPTGVESVVEAALAAV